MDYKTHNNYCKKCEKYNVGTYTSFQKEICNTCNNAVIYLEKGQIILTTTVSRFNEKLQTWRQRVLHFTGITPEYQWFNGKHFSQIDCDLYNRNRREITQNEFFGSNKEITETLKNENHKLIVGIL